MRPTCGEQHRSNARAEDAGRANESSGDADLLTDSPLNTVEDGSFEGSLFLSRWSIPAISAAISSIRRRLRFISLALAVPTVSQSIYHVARSPHLQGRFVHSVARLTNTPTCKEVRQPSFAQACGLGIGIQIIAPTATDDPSRRLAVSCGGYPSVLTPAQKANS